MQKIPEHTGPSLLAAWWYSGANKGQKWDLRCNEHLKKMVFKDPLETFLLTPSQEGRKKTKQNKTTLIKMHDRTSKKSIIYRPA